MDRLHVALGALLVLYAASLALRRPAQSWPLLDDWGVDGFEVLIGLLCLFRALRPGPGRWAAAALGVGVMSWALGDVAWSFESIGGSMPPVPSVADGFYLAFYPMAYVAVMLSVRTELRSFRASVWMDGAVAGLGGAAVSAAFAFDTILKATGGPPAAVAVNMAYPIGDLVLLGLALAAAAMTARWSARWVLLGSGCVLMAVGDTIYLFQSSANTYHVGTLLDATWPASLLLLSLATWRPVRRPEMRRSEISPWLWSLSGLSVAAGLAIVIASTFEHVSHVALWLAVGTLVAASIRLSLALRELQTLTEARRRQSVTDELTGLANRRFLMQELERHFSVDERPTAGGSLALLMIDLNHFKEVNDSFGHQVGDELLTLIGPRIAGALRDGDVVARLGGDEFAVVLHNADAPGAIAVAIRVAEALEAPMELGPACLHISGSIGIAAAPQHAGDAIDLLRCADVAMYVAKAGHRLYEVYEPELDDGIGRMRMIEELRAAIDEGRLTLDYQPQVSLRNGDLTAVEALVRWRHPALGSVPPEQFIGVAEENGLMRQLTAFVLERAMAQCAAWRDAGHQVAVSVNLSATNLVEVDLPERVAALLTRYALPAGSIVLEITESMVMANIDEAIAAVERLRSLGIVISLDDFGTGYSSLACLSRLPVGELKIDRAFVANLGHSDTDRDAEIVRSTVQLGHALGLRVVAEGVEDGGTLKLLRRLGCDIAQGYFISRPLPADQLDLSAVLGRATADLSVVTA